MWVPSRSLLICRNGFPQDMPFSQTYPMCCINIRNFVEQFYLFADGVSQHHLDIDEVLRKVRGIFAPADLAVIGRSPYRTR